jgi:hypothetical protein
VAKPEKLPEGAAVPEKKPVLPFNGAENARKFHEAFKELKTKNDKAQVGVPGSRRSIEFTKVDVDDKKLSIWIGEDTDKEPDFVVVNPPTEIKNSAGALVEDPLTAIALIIDGATK